MRNPKRIPLYLEYLVSYIKLFHKAGVSYHLTENFDKFSTYWKANPDQRLGQALFNMGLWNKDYHTECADIINRITGVEYNELLFWEARYDENMKLLKTPKKILIKDMSTDHLKKLITGIIKGVFVKPQDNYLNALWIELKTRI